jgi:hypothetical protein
MTGYFDLTAALPDRAGPLASWLPVVMHLCSGLARNWTKRQAEITWHALMSNYTTHESIADASDAPGQKANRDGIAAGGQLARTSGTDCRI